MPTAPLTLPPPAAKPIPQPAQKAAAAAPSPKAGGRRAEGRAAEEPRFDEALKKAESRTELDQAPVEAKAAPESAQERPEAAQIEPAASEPEAAPVEDSTETTAPEGEAAPEAAAPVETGDAKPTADERPEAQSAEKATRPESERAAQARFVAESALPKAPAATQAQAAPQDAVVASAQSEIGASSVVQAEAAPASEAEAAPTKPTENANQRQRLDRPAGVQPEATAATGTPADVASADASRAGEAAGEAPELEVRIEPASPDEPRAEQPRRVVAKGDRGVEAAPAAVHEPSRAVEARRESSDAAVLKALAGQERAPVNAGAGARTGSEDPSKQQERRDAGVKVVEAAAKASAGAPASATGGAERAAPIFTVTHSAPVDAQPTAPTAQVRPESAGFAPPTPEDDGVAAQVTRGLTAAVSQKGGTVTMRLQPESLGAVRIQMQIHQGVVQARFDASTPEARDLLNKHMETLRTSLEAKGLSVDRLQVQLASPGHGGTGGQTGQHGSSAEQDAQRWWSHDAADGRSRGAFDHRPEGEDRRDGRGENRWSRAGAERWDDEGPDSGRRASVVRVGLDAVA